MDIENYISSGVLENYVLGLLSETESSEVVRMIERHAEIADYVRSLEQSLASYGQLHSVQPPAELKSKILDQIRKLNRPGEQRDDSFPGSREQSDAPGFLYNHLRIWRRLAIAGTIILVASLAFNLYLSTQKFKVQQRAQSLARQNKALILDSKSAQQKLTQAEKQLTLLSQPDIHPVVMKGVQQHPAFRVTVYWNTNDRTVYLGKSDLPAVPAGKIYQLWAIVDGKPVDLGLYNPGNTPLPVPMKNVRAGQVQAFAITLEKEGGNPTPTMDQMYVMGAAS